MSAVTPLNVLHALRACRRKPLWSLAELYGNAQAAHIHIGNGLQHHDNGGMNVRSVACLPAITGQWLKQGGGAVRTNSYASTNSDALERPEPAAESGAASGEHEPDW